MISFFAVAMFVLNLVLSKYGVIGSIVLAVVSAIVFAISLEFLNKQSESIELVSAIISLLVAYLGPLACGPSSPYFGCVHFLKPHLIFWIGSVVVGTIIPPLIIGSIWNDTELPFYIKSVLIIHSINRSFAEPHVYSIALILCYFLFEIDLGPSHDKGYSYLFSLIIAKKLFSMLPFFEYVYEAPRRVFNEIPFFGFWLLRQLPVFKAPLYLGIAWGILTGSPACLRIPDIFVIAPSSPRPNAFWDHPRRQSFSDSSRPVEYIVYSSLKTALVTSLFSYIRKCNLSTVCENSFFVFIDEPAIALVHIIAIQGTRVYFQIRGAEFRSQTFCHHTELTVLSRLAGYEYFWKFNSDVIYYYWMSAYRPLGIPIELLSYEASQFTWERAFISVPQSDQSIWFFLSLCYFWFQENNVERLAELSGSESEDLIRFYHLFCNVDQICSEILDVHRALMAAFQNGNQVNCFTNGLPDVEGEMSGIAQKAFQFGVLLLSLAGADLTPKLDEEKDQLLEFLEETNREYAILGSDKLVCEDGQSLFTILEVHHEIVVTFYRKHLTYWRMFKFQRDVVRSLWATEAVNCIFYRQRDAERWTIQAHPGELHNLIVQLSDLPTDYPAYVSEIAVSEMDCLFR
jgi:hypothetical protein